MRLMMRRIKRFVVYRILHVDDTPHRIALGVAIGVFVAWTPFPGLQMVLAVIIAALLRANKVVGLPLVWLNNPLTAPVNLLCYWLGCWMLRMASNGERIVQAIREALAPRMDFAHRIVSFFHAVEDAFLPWLVGSIVVGLVSGTAVYLLTYRAVSMVRQRRATRRARREAARRIAGAGGGSNALMPQAVTERPGSSGSGSST